VLERSIIGALIMLCRANCSSTSAQESKQPPAPPPATSSGVAILPPGTDSCGTYTNARRQAENNDPRSMFLSVEIKGWIEGFLSGAAATGVPNLQARINTALRRTDSQGIITWIDNYCRTHPLENITIAVYNLLTELIQKEAN
jgi:hypothetical protein